MSVFLFKQRSFSSRWLFVSSLEENDHLKAENRSLKKDLLTAIENGAGGNKKVSLKGAFPRYFLFVYLVRLENFMAPKDDRFMSLSATFFSWPCLLPRESVPVQGTRSRNDLLVARKSVREQNYLGDGGGGACGNLVPLFQTSLRAKPFITFSSPEPRSFWPAAGIESSGRTPFSEHVHRIRFIFSTNQICQIWREVRESQTSDVPDLTGSPWIADFRCARFDGKSVNRGLPVLDKARALDPCRRSEWSWALGTRMHSLEYVFNQAHFPMNDFAWRLVLKQRLLRTGTLAMQVA